jgi:hypothetical protein
MYTGSGSGPGVYINVPVGPATSGGYAMTHYAVSFAFSNTSLAAAPTPPAPTTFSNDVWSIGTFPATSPPSYMLTIEVTPQANPALNADVYATTTSDQCNAYTTFYEFG